MSHSKYFTGKLYQRMSDDLHLAGMSQRTHGGYLRAVRKLADYSKTSPDKVMGHSSLQTTMVYLHLTKTGEVKSREVIARLFRR